ncbi:hypothetical protein I1A49_33125 [Streptomyces malaysiensis subsp. malaysiensis]|uniref:Uncharacterized protein n=2 Tax=Streptomyces malaysiensis TaxID=92644 RepID=A0ABX6WFG0_STRMQ|nr:MULTISPECIES: hypothetical protein [Streptomyces]QPI59106.1 hypothetical protein I1A49_33125 [Streptomyces solisilvae]UHH20751.1 hypothetical protein LUV23_33345 [Streptomyces sp. HNM0561]
MKSTRVKRHAQKLQLATGMSWTDALKRVKSLPPASPLIPEAQPSQAVLEGYILSGHAWPMIDTRNPWGIRSAGPRPDSLTLTFENDVTQSLASESMARELIRNLVPCFDEHGEVRGIPGARFTANTDGIQIRRLGMPGSITILGIPAEDWFAALPLQREENAADGRRYCHEPSPHRWHHSEAAFREPATSTVLGRYHHRKRPSAWLASGLLRRAPLMRTIGLPLSTTAWTNLTEDGGSEWITEYINEPLADAPCYHEGFTNLLTDPDCGLPLAGTELDCCRGLPPESYWGCRFYARSGTGQPGALQVRFSRRSGDRAHFYKTNPTEYEKRRQLYQPVPAHLSRRHAEPMHNRHQNG